MSLLLEVDGLGCAYQDTQVVSNVSFSVRSGEIACLLGPSGCGKTTVLRAIAGFNQVQAGTISLNTKQVSSLGSMLPPEQRNLGMVFQDYALFPHLNVFDNISFGLKTLSRRDKSRVVKEMLALVRLPDIAEVYPHELSGGQQQRVAMARALASKPQMILMDEPFSNLDAELRKQLSIEVRDILKEQGIAAIVVTHDQEEAFAISDRIGILADGALQQWGAPQELYYQPSNPLVASFVGKGDLFEGVCVTENQVRSELGLVEFAEPFCVPVGSGVELFIRPSDLLLSTEGGVKVEVLHFEFLGSVTHYAVRLPSGRTVKVESRERFSFDSGDQASLHVAAHRPIAFL